MQAYADGNPDNRSQCSLVGQYEILRYERWNLMGLCAFQKNTTVRISGVEYTLLRQATDTLWQLEDTKSRRIVELEHDQILHHIADGTLTFPGSKIAEIRRPTSVID